MKKICTTLMMALMAMTASAQEQKDTTYVMFDFNLNPWNYPVTTTIKGWQPDINDETGALFTDTDFTWPVAEGSDKLITVTFTAIDLDEYSKPNFLAKLENYDIKTVTGSDSVMTMLYAYQGTTMRMKAPDGYQFGKIVFYNYRTSNFLVGDEYEEKSINSKGFEETRKFWTATLPKQNSYGMNIWDGDAKNIVFNYPYFSAVFMKMDIRLVPDGEAKPEVLKGDANGDGILNVADVLTVVNHLLGSTAAHFNQEAADVNGDGAVNMTDIAELAKILLK